MKILNLLAISCILIFGLSGCGIGKDSDSPQPEFKCTQPCITNSPVLSISSISSATGGTVEIKLTLDKPAEKVYVVLYPYRFDCPTAGFLPGNTKYNLIAGLQYTFTISIYTGMPACSYYPEVNIRPIQSEPYFGLFWRHRSDDANYYYQEKLMGGGNEGPIVRTQFVIPVVEVTE